MNKYIFAEKALVEIPKILTLLDRNPHSPTYGCFDRNYWHYKIIDFPSGMSQEFVWPLALAYITDIPGNDYYRKDVVKQWVYAGIKFAAKSAHSDSSCDDYFPFEKASGAAAFSLLAFIESYKICQFVDQKIIDFFCRRADWLAEHIESGKLSNHQALIALCLDLLGNMLNTKKWELKKNERIKRVLSWQNEEGWFQEYEGFDPGYHTLTVLFLSWLYDMNPGNNELKMAVSKAIDLSIEFIHPDGTFGGEYGSRNTNNFFSYGFELSGKWKKESLSINDRFMKALGNGLAPCYSDDHILGHHLWNYFLTFKDFIEKRPGPDLQKRQRLLLKNAQIIIDRRGDFEIYMALNKGGVFKLFHKNKLICADTNFSIMEKKKNAVAHLIDHYETVINEDEIIVSGYLGWAKQQQMTSLKLIILRMVMFFGGRFFPDFIRKLLQLLLITGKQKSKYFFTRKIKWINREIEVTDKISACNWNDVKHAGIGCDQTSIYVVMSRTFHKGQLQEFINLDDALKALKPSEDLVVKRVFP